MHGGFAAQQYKGWQCTQWCPILLAVVTHIPCLLMEKTYKEVILQKRAKRLHLAPPPGPKVTSLRYWQTRATVTTTRPIAMMFAEPLVLLFGLYNPFTFSLLFAFFAAFPYTYAKDYQFHTWQTGFTFISIGLGVLIAAATAINFDRLIYRKKHDQALAEGKGPVPPEERLCAGMAGAIELPIGLFWFAWTARSNIHWISPAAAGIPFAWGNLALFLAATLFMIDVYGPMNGASAVAANGLMRYTFGACFPLFTVRMYERLGIAWATSLLRIHLHCDATYPICFL
ncbi:hypothetical protein AC579_1398 [Pseudocercospora musae]|uniref:Uncharacterized protein n=1 Tax=Pseudocercospora musae TaxID=113226 RepID=A0A139IFS6_9PEZI|nr:hypothetical protein AC579_1398 [Pseudocercospora musae]